MVRQSGLANLRSRARDCGGDLSVQSAPCGGTVCGGGLRSLVTYGPVVGHGRRRKMSWCPRYLLIAAPFEWRSHWRSVRRRCTTPNLGAGQWARTVCSCTSCGRCSWCTPIPTGAT